MALAKEGIDIRQSSGHIAFRAFLQDSAGAIVTSGTTSLYLYELQSDGTLKSYDWNDNTFKTTALTTETQALTHRTGNNGATNTGIWTHVLTTITGFTLGGIYLARIKNTGASPTDQVREFQFGGSVERAGRAIITGTVGSGSTTTSIVCSSVSVSPSDADQWKGRVLIFDRDTLTGGLAGEAGISISANTTGATPTITVPALTRAPASGDTFTIT